MIGEFPLIRGLLEQKGYRFTNQRRIILEELINAESHINAEEIYEKVKGRNVGLATVYRTLDIFTCLGIAKEINVDGVNYYEQKIYSKRPLHIHLKCTKCNNIIDIYDREVVKEYLKLNRVMEQNNNIQINDIDIMLLGICTSCLEGTECQGRLNGEG